ncbi:hypothetical protein ABK040_008094 [Willaertia magna]
MQQGNNKPFSFMAQAFSYDKNKNSGTNLNNNNTSEVSRKNLLNSLNDLFQQTFLEKLKNWNRLHEQSIEYLTSYIQYVNFLHDYNINNSNNNNTGEEGLTISLTTKLKKSHEDLFNIVQEFYKVVEELKEILNQMKNKIILFIEKNNKDSNSSPTNSSEITSTDNNEKITELLLSKGSYHLEMNCFDYLNDCNNYLEMLENELDFKTIVFQSLNEYENTFVLNNYFISWKKQCFLSLDKIREMEMKWKLNEKIKLNI